MNKAQVIVTSCSRRSLEIEQINRFLQGNGYALSNDNWNVDPIADLILLSTCGFTQAAEDFGFETLRRIQRDKKPEAHIVFGGCIPQINPARVSKEFDGPTFSPQSYSQLNKILRATRRFEEFERPNTFPALSLSFIKDFRNGIEILKTFDGSLSGLGHISQRLSNGVRQRLIRTRYANLYNHKTFYIQIQEGCSMHCSYCVIRMAIGPLRSKPIEAVVSEFESGLNQGYRHFQLMGDNAGSYGLDIGINMGDLLKRILDTNKDFDLDPTDLNPVYLHLIFEPTKRLCAEKRVSSLYVPIQSGSRRILKLMGRDCDMDAVKRMLIDIKKSASSKFKMGTSLIVGFPSETVEELNETIAFCSQIEFDWVWCHSFSARPGTPAGILSGQIPADEI